MPIIDPQEYSKMTGAQKELYTASLGNSPSSYQPPLQSGVSSPSPIVASDLNKDIKLFVPPETPKVDYAGAVAGAIAGATTLPKTYTTPSGATVDAQGNVMTSAPTSATSTASAPPTTDYTALMKSLMGEQPATPSITDLYKQQVGDQEYIAKQKEVADLDAQLKALDAQKIAGQLGLETQDIRRTTGVLDRMQGQIDREYAIKALPITAKLNAAQGRLDMATQNINTLMDLQYKDYQIKKDYNDTLYSRAYDIATKDQQQKLDVWKVERENEATATKDLLDYKKEWIKTATDNGDITTASLLGSAKTREEIDSLTGQIKSQNVTYDTFTQDGNVYQVKKDKKTGQVIGTPTLVQGGGVGGGNNDDLIAYAQLYSDTGKPPSPAELKSSGLTISDVTSMAKQLPKSNGTLVSKNTGTKSSALSPTQETAISALSEIVTSTLPNLQATFPKIATGILGGIGGMIWTSQNKQNYLTWRAEFLSKLLVARSGAAVTEQEYARYAKLLPTTFNQPFFLGSDGLKKLNSLQTSMKNNLDSLLDTQQLSIYGYSKVKVNGIDRTVGEVLDIGGVQYKVLPDGTLTDTI
jgi:hypothetical protein